ncbi:HAMP domain-containing methyl-accepting chemotaxis protein [Reichenbachiella agarivorans]|uniref:HAMP domain-containing methyl-accepting chemotaxis protein n=1 Tax=Reichenbachiella agarivorans TaxID=2979464 RepID=A0ABY6CMI5_9BACT|nr:HAMP domain-containing methyl-accepting chemotaxis protein [Reichenbachiella agarivorans]UXP30959.1 HAMP domain-containing methyl-accepting chemotaxis protein [Reichenbachiella agarivorans]
MQIFKGLSGKFIISYLLTLLFGVWTYFALQNISNYESLKDSLQDMHLSLLQARQFEHEFLTRDFREVDFLETGYSINLTNNQSIIDSLRAFNFQLREEEIIAADELDSTAALLHSYSEIMSQLALQLHQRGFKDHGMEGRLRRAIHEVENADYEYDKVLMLMLRRHEKDFFLRHDLKYLDKFNEGIIDLKNNIMEVGKQDLDKRDQILARIDSYQKNFNQIVEMNQVIGLDENDGLLGELNVVSMALSAAVDDLILKVGIHADRKVRYNIYAVVVLMIIILAIGVVILYTHIFKITRNINVINSSATKLANGRFPTLAKVNSRDELGKAHSALNVLIEGLRAKTQFALEVGQGKLDTQLDVLGKKDQLGSSLIELKVNLKRALLEIHHVVREAGKNGELKTRVSLDDKLGVWEDFSKAINKLLESLTLPFEQVNQIVQDMSNGDFTTRYQGETKGEIALLAQNLNSSLDKLNELLINISEHADQINDSSSAMLVLNAEMGNSTSEIASATSQMSAGAQNQVIKVDESSTLVEAILNSSDEMAKRSESINLAAKTGYEDSEHGAKMSREMVNSITQIANYTEEANQSMDVLTERSKEINRVLRVMNDISSQTNLLALNAAIEAAQAGDSGRGFAVVAEEIRKLAEDSKKAAKEIEILVSDVQKDTSSASQVIDLMRSAVDSGEKISKEAEEVFYRISKSSANTLSLSQDILDASATQKGDITQIVSITESIVVIAEQTAAGTEQVATSAVELAQGMKDYNSRSRALSDIAHDLKLILSRFKTKVGVEEAVQTQVDLYEPQPMKQPPLAQELA